MKAPPLCASCGTNPVGYATRPDCYECRPKRERVVCAGCGTNPVPYPGRSHCYGCRPKHPGWAPSRCWRCGSTTLYYAGGLCRRCHRLARWVDSCRDCLAWGVTERNDWRCEGCRGLFRRIGVITACLCCRRTVAVNRRGFCRLCTRQAHQARPAHRSIDVAWANRHGQQLFLADLFRQKRPGPAPPEPVPTAPPGRYPVSHRQLILFQADRNLAAAGHRGFPNPPLPDLQALLENATLDRAARHGWCNNLAVIVRRGLRVLLATQDTPGAPITASAAAQLAQLPHFAHVRAVLEVLQDTGLLDDDRHHCLEDWFTRRTADLPEDMAGEVRTWFRALMDGHPTPPRSHPRHPDTIRSLVTHVLPALHAWSTDGHQSLREITKPDVTAQLTGPAHQHAATLQGLRSLFRWLRARHLIFINPTAHLRGPLQQPNPPLPLDLTPIREALASTNPARAALAALVAFHAPSTADLRSLQLTDIRDGRLHLTARTALLATPVRERLARWLNERTRRWPHTSNPHLFINFYTAVRTCPVSRLWVINTLGMSPQALREDRILDEALATHGDARRLGDLFGLTISGAVRYTHTTHQPPPRSTTGTEARE